MRLYPSEHPSQVDTSIIHTLFLNLVYVLNTQKHSLPIYHAGDISISIYSPDTPAEAFVGGTGTPGDPYIIATCQDLQDIQTTSLTASYVLGKDIDCSDTTNWNSGLGFAPLNTFSGKFNGNYHTIKNLSINI